MGSLRVTEQPRRRALSIAGSDSGGGAGIQADLKTFSALGVYGMTAITAVTVQNTQGVSGYQALSPSTVAEQVRAVVTDIGVDAAKTGMLFSEAVIVAVADFLEGRNVPLVVDPVMVASSGARLLQPDAATALVRRLFPLATVVTPNLMEAEAIVGRSAPRRDLAEALVALGARAALVTGGHGEEPVDHLFDGREHVEIPVERHDSETTHGAGCTHSATLCALLARGFSLRDAAVEAARVASRAVADGLSELGVGEGPVDVLGLRHVVAR
jgi:hydroxymethylpyrimidine/phosphomethylpyrimidine kinase